MRVGEETEGAGDVGVVGAAVGIVSVEPAVDGFAGGERAAEEDQGTKKGGDDPLDRRRQTLL